MGNSLSTFVAFTLHIQLTLYKNDFTTTTTTGKGEPIQLYQPGKNPKDIGSQF